MFSSHTAAHTHDLVRATSYLDAHPCDSATQPGTVATLILDHRPNNTTSLERFSYVRYADHSQEGFRLIFLISSHCMRWKRLKVCSTRTTSLTERGSLACDNGDPYNPSVVGLRLQRHFISDHVSKFASAL